MCEVHHSPHLSWGQAHRSEQRLGALRFVPVGINVAPDVEKLLERGLLRRNLRLQALREGRV